MPVHGKKFDSVRPVCQVGGLEVLLTQVCSQLSVAVDHFSDGPELDVAHGADAVNYEHQLVNMRCFSIRNLGQAFQAAMNYPGFQLGILKIEFSRRECM